MIARILSALCLTVISSAAFAHWTGDYMSFGIASGAGAYNITSFSGSRLCWSYHSATKKEISSNGNIMCNVPYKNIGSFSLTLTKVGSVKDECIVKITTNTKWAPIYVSEQGSTCPGINISNMDPYHKKFHYGDIQVSMP